MSLRDFNGGVLNWNLIKEFFVLKQILFAVVIFINFIKTHIEILQFIDYFAMKNVKIRMS